MKLSCYLGNFLDFNGEKNEQVVYSSRYDARITDRKKRYFYRAFKNRNHKTFISRLKVADPAIPMFNEVKVRHIPRELKLVHCLQGISSGDLRYDVDEVVEKTERNDSTDVFVIQAKAAKFNDLPKDFRDEMYYLLSCYTDFTNVVVQDYDCGVLVDPKGEYEYHKISIKIKKCRFNLFIKLYDSEDFVNYDFVLIRL